jgi:membrane-bound lytic murein transglycosylase B
MRLYLRAGRQYGLAWAELAAIGQLESDQGRSMMPGVSRATNRHGAAGPAQFVSPTWARYGVDGNGDGKISPYDPSDAIPSMAAYLKASGAPADWAGAIYAYNHSLSYVAAVLSLTHRFDPSGR